MSYIDHEIRACDHTGRVLSEEELRREILDFLTEYAKRNHHSLSILRGSQDNLVWDSPTFNRAVYTSPGKRWLPLLAQAIMDDPEVLEDWLIYHRFTFTT